MAKSEMFPTSSARNSVYRALCEGLPLQFHPYVDEIMYEVEQLVRSSPAREAAATARYVLPAARALLASHSISGSIRDFVHALDEYLPPVVANLINELKDFSIDPEAEALSKSIEMFVRYHPEMLVRE